jgi:protein-S-isoprenylcysteine O-methyltransferase Ste14
LTRTRSFLAIPVIGSLILGVYATCVLLTSLVGLSWNLSAPWPARLLGVPLLAYGVAMIAWVVHFRGAGPILDSTWVTLTKLLRREPLESAAGRTEPLAVAGPYRLVRHPLYSGVDALALGIAILTDHPWAYLAAVILGAWFAFVLAPFEERELAALFGPAYQDCMRGHRRFLPTPWRKDWVAALRAR